MEGEGGDGGRGKGWRERGGWWANNIQSICVYFVCFIQFKGFGQMI